MGDEATAWRGSREQGLSLHSPQNDGDAVRCTGELRTDPQRGGRMGMLAAPQPRRAQLARQRAAVGGREESGSPDSAPSPAAAGMDAGGSLCLPHFSQGGGKRVCPVSPGLGGTGPRLQAAASWGERAVRSHWEAASFAALVSADPQAATSGLRSVTAARGRASPFPPHTLRPPIHPEGANVPITTRKRPAPAWAGETLPLLCGVLVFGHHLWHVHGRVRRPRHSEGLLPLLLQRVRGRGRPMGSCLHGRGRRRRQGRSLVRRRHRRGGRR